MTGIRRVEAPTRANAPLISFDDAFGLVKINPIAPWSDEEMQNYIDDQFHPRQSSCRRGISVHRLRTLHQQASPRQPIRVAVVGPVPPRPNAGCTHHDS